MKMKSLLPSDQPIRPWQLTFLVLLLIALILLIPSGGMLADSNAPTVTNTPEPTVTNTPVPEQPTNVPAQATNTPILMIPTLDISDQDAITVISPPPDNGSRLSTIDRILLAILAIAVVLIVGVIVYIFINQTREGL